MLPNFLRDVLRFFTLAAIFLSRPSPPLCMFPAKFNVMHALAFIFVRALLPCTL